MAFTGSFFSSRPATTGGTSLFASSLPSPPTWCVFSTPPKKKPSDRFLTPFILCQKLKFVYENDDHDSDFVCSICHDPLMDPVVEPECRQMFCHECLRTWLAQRPSCPQCQQPTDITRIMLPPHFMTTKLDGLRVVCPSCGGKCTHKSLHEHVASCPIRTYIHPLQLAVFAHALS